MVRGIERSSIRRDGRDRAEFVQDRGGPAFAPKPPPNHAHRPGSRAFQAYWPPIATVKLTDSSLYGDGM